MNNYAERINNYVLPHFAGRNIFSYLCDYHGCDNNPVDHVPRLRDNSPYEEIGLISVQ